MIDQQTVAKILDTAQILDVVSDFVTLKRRGVNYIGLCPFHDEKTGSFTVSPAKGIYKCFGCGKGGGPVQFIMEHEQLDFPGALRYLAKKYNIPIVEKELTAEEQQHQSDRESMFALNTWAKNYFTDQMNKTDDGRAIGLAYFHERGISDESIEKFGLGYCHDQANAMVKAAIDSGYKSEFIEKCGLGAKRDNGTWYDRFRGRVIFPVHTLSGKVVAFGGRVLVKNDKTAKYVNSPESEIYHKSNELYGIYFAKQTIVKEDRCFLVEGYTDVISMHQAGIKNVVASSGTSLTPGQIRLIHRFTQNVTVLYDGDSAGIKASIRGIDLLLEEGMNIKVVLLPDGEDPDSFARSNDASKFIEFIDNNQVDFIKFKINLLLDDIGDDPIKRAGLISDVVNSISLIPDRIVRSVYVRECANQLEIDEEIVLAEIKKILSERRAKELTRKTNYNAQQNPYKDNEPKHETNPAYRNPGAVSAAPAIESPTSAQPIKTEQYPFRQEELNILNYIVRNGNDMIFSNGERMLSVSEYIADSLQDLDENGKGVFRNPLHQKMLEEALKITGQSDKSCIKHFINNPDPKISSISAELIADKYTVSKMFDRETDYTGDKKDLEAIEMYKNKIAQEKINQLANEIHLVIHEYKTAIILQKEHEIETQIQTAQESKNYDEIMDLLRKKQNLLEIKKALSGQTGGRVILGRR